MDLGPFLWFGGEPGKPLPPLGDRVGKHSKGDSTGNKAARPKIRLIVKGQFSTLSSMAEVAQALFGNEIFP
jgi:hypothetical protein